MIYFRLAEAIFLKVTICLPLSQPIGRSLLKSATIQSSNVLILVNYCHFNYITVKMKLVNGK